MRFKIQMVILFFALLFILTITFQGQIFQEIKQPKSDVEYFSDIQYRDGNPAWRLDIAKPINISGKMPAIICIHGGGWRSGDKNGQRGLITRFAKEGFVAISVRYRLIDEAVFPACIIDVKTSLKWIKEHATEFSVDTNRIGSFGHSAGAHLAAMLGMVPKETNFGDDFQKYYTAPVNAVCGIATPTDFINWNVDRNKPNGTTALFGGDVNTLLEREKLASPISYISPATPPFLLIHGNDDKTVPLIQVSRFRTELTEKGSNKIELIILDGIGHDPMLSHEMILWPMIIAFFNGTIGSNPNTLYDQIEIAYEWKSFQRDRKEFNFENIKFMDINGDRSITSEEFTGSKEFFDRLDNIQNNIISIEDFYSSKPLIKNTN